MFQSSKDYAVVCKGVYENLVDLNVKIPFCILTNIKISYPYNNCKNVIGWNQFLKNWMFMLLIFRKTSVSFKVLLHTRIYRFLIRSTIEYFSHICDNSYRSWLFQVCFQEIAHPVPLPSNLDGTNGSSAWSRRYHSFTVEIPAATLFILRENLYFPPASALPQSYTPVCHESSITK